MLEFVRIRRFRAAPGNLVAIDLVSIAAAAFTAGSAERRRAASP
jgi:hypothetical protein